MGEYCIKNLEKMSLLCNYRGKKKIEILVIYFIHIVSNHGNIVCYFPLLKICHFKWWFFFTLKITTGKMIYENNDL